jgi:hypothetical protein
LRWLESDLSSLTHAIQRSAEEARNAARRLAHSLADPDFAGVRDEPSLQALPEPEHSTWRALWQARRKALASAKQE